MPLPLCRELTSDSREGISGPLISIFVFLEKILLENKENDFLN